MKLDDIGFYTLTDERARTASPLSPLCRCELLVTDACNFRCPYCRGVATSKNRHMEWSEAKRILDAWIDDGLVNVRFSGGEPTLWPHIVEAVAYCKAHGVQRVALSTNGSADWSVYDALLAAGADDFSVSFDACCSSTGDTMSGVSGAWERIVANTRKLSERVYTTVGCVLTDDNIGQVAEVVTLADSLGVADVRIIPAAQYGSRASVGIVDEIADRHPILRYRLDNMHNGRPFRGLSRSDSPRCSLVMDDMAVSDGKHYPCIIYLREGGEAIGEVGGQMRTERAVWSKLHDTQSDPICRGNCLDVCADYNNRATRNLAS